MANTSGDDKVPWTRPSYATKNEGNLRKKVGSDPCVAYTECNQPEKFVVSLHTVILYYLLFILVFLYLYMFIYICPYIILYIYIYSFIFIFLRTYYGHLYEYLYEYLCKRHGLKRVSQQSQALALSARNGSAPQEGVRNCIRVKVFVKGVRKMCSQRCS